MHDETPPPRLGDMSPAEFRRHGHHLIDWIADYFEHPERYPIMSRSKPGDIKQQLPSAPPTAPEPFEAIFKDFEQHILPGVTHWNHPGFFGYFSLTGSSPGILGELLMSALNVTAMVWRTSPAATELEEVVVDWVRQMMGLPAEFRGMLVDTASIASMTAFAGARERAGLSIREKGMAGRAELPRLRVYISEQAHSSLDKAALTVGIGQEGIRKIPVDERFSMRAGELERAIQEDLAAGWRPLCVVPTIGTTSSASIDPVPEVAEICRRHGIWMHVDAAQGGAAAIAPELRPLLAGWEHGDSIVVNLHKWMFVPMDCTVLFVREPRVLKQAFSLVPAYLESATTRSDEITNYMDWSLQLGRRFRALKLWMVLRSFGQETLAAHIRNHIAMAGELAARIQAEPDFELLAPRSFSTLCLRARPRDLEPLLRQGPPEEKGKVEAYLNELNEATLEAVNATGRVLLSQTKLNGRFTLRISIGNMRTTEAYAQEAWELVRKHAQSLDARRRETGRLSLRG
ncbi:pyridoxal phosphate-dependent decarboxylase family protein [Hyalangium sp.]|uniref:pyridoxal phosphate-dependent decarboxylase family protein n=1 Tax=Hyalangium sp. TaxID=2028555 RepID=UPI002D234BC2|nr:pyridoxal-dependent decarboxylase [Hyalangium sp.]HYI00139.1 pyridoxal-dependent decarboxylase [Hyalangium sp.]